MKINTINRKMAIVSHSPEGKHVAFVEADGSVSLKFPIDRALTLQSLPGDRFLVQQALQVVEFDLTGKSLWRYRIIDSEDCSLEERAELGAELMGAWRLPSGNTLIGDFRCGGFYELTPQFEEVNRFPYPYDTLGDRHFWWRAFRVLDNGNLLIGGYEHQKVIELTRTGKVVWEADVDGNPYEAIRMNNGNTLVSLGPSGKLAELDPSGASVWQADTAKLWDARYAPWISGIAQLENGNILYADYFNSCLFELERSGRLVGKLYDREIFRNPASLLVL